MMKCDHGSHAAVFKSAQHGTIFFKCVFIPAIRRRLNAAPLDRQAMCVLTRFSGAVEIFAPASTPPIGRKSGFICSVTLLLPFMPVVICIVAFHLMGCSCRSPQKSLWKMIRCLRHYFSLILTTDGHR